MMMLKTRDEFPMLLDELGCETAAEIGVWLGDFSRVLLHSKSLKKLYLIDPWDQFPEHWEAVQRLAGEDSRVELLRGRSPEVIRQVDFSYIDDIHYYANVKTNMKAWWQVTSKVMAGHDYVPYNLAGNDYCGVIPAVEEFAMYRGLNVHLTGAYECSNYVERMIMAHEVAGRDAITYPSWWIEKPTERRV